MTSRHNARAATLVGGGLILGVMLLHPTGAEAVADASAGGTRHTLALATAVHAVAIGAVPLLLAGMTALTWRLRAARELAIGALICFALASVAVLFAAAMSGLVAPTLLAGLRPVGDPARELALQQLHYTGVLNQAFATVYVGLAGAAFGLWALAMRGDRAFPAALRWGAVLAGILPIIGVAVGHLRLDVRGFGLVVVLHSAWMMTAAWVARGDATPIAAVTPP
ncbi:MAG: hypothetical protein K2R93_02805 [Gemmatimonadaceae bacterium]|nr:hypothetical protein [Gemmatimonadaceae bacterium]